MPPPCHHEPPVEACRLCQLYRTDPAYRALWDGSPRFSARSLPCIYLGETIDRLNCACPGRWLRKCAVHGVTTIDHCKNCADYETCDGSSGCC